MTSPAPQCRGWIQWRQRRGQEASNKYKADFCALATDGSYLYIQGEHGIAKFVLAVMALWRGFYIYDSHGDSASFMIPELDHQDTGNRIGNTPAAAAGGSVTAAESFAEDGGACAGESKDDVIESRRIPS